MIRNWFNVHVRCINTHFVKIYYVPDTAIFPNFYITRSLRNALSNSTATLKHIVIRIQCCIQHNNKINIKKLRVTNTLHNPLSIQHQTCSKSSNVCYATTPFCTISTTNIVHAKFIAAFDTTIKLILKISVKVCHTVSSVSNWCVKCVKMVCQVCQTGVKLVCQPCQI